MPDHGGANKEGLRFGSLFEINRLGESALQVLGGVSRGSGDLGEGEDLGVRYLSKPGASLFASLENMLELART